MRSNLLQHPLPQHLISPRLIPLTILLQPREHIRIQPQTHRLLHGPIESSSYRILPSTLRQRRRIGKVNLTIRHLCQRFKPLLLFLRHRRTGLPFSDPFHIFSFHEAPLCAPRSAVHIPHHPRSPKYAQLTTARLHSPFQLSASDVPHKRSFPAWKYVMDRQRQRQRPHKEIPCFRRLMAFFFSSQSNIKQHLDFDLSGSSQYLQICIYSFAENLNPTSPNRS